LLHDFRVAHDSATLLRVTNPSVAHVIRANSQWDMVCRQGGLELSRSNEQRAISIRQPWAYAILHLGKDVENRPMRTHYRGRILIQASLTTTDQERAASRKLGLDSDGLLRGAIVGDIEIVDCVHNSKSEWAVRGQWHWILKSPRVLAKPIPFKGALGFVRVQPKLLSGKRFSAPNQARK
jgi:hypothetical protein